MFSDLDIKNLFFRAISCIFIFFIFLLGILYSKESFLILMSSCAILMLYEWHNMTKNSYFDQFIGYILIIISMYSLIKTRDFKFGEVILLQYFLVIWIFDIFSMFGGKFMGGRKLAPVISPAKTWSGFLSGLFFTIIMISIPFLHYPEKFINILNYKPYIDYNEYNKLYDNFYSILVIIPMAVLTLCGDLFVSYFKRKYKIKDTGNIIPGHGGILDRLDSIILSGPYLLICMSVFKWLYQGS